MTTIRLSVDSVAHGGHCVARHEGRVIFVRHTLPGEVVEAVVSVDCPLGDIIVRHRDGGVDTSLLALIKAKAPSRILRTVRARATGAGRRRRQSMVSQSGISAVQFISLMKATGPDLYKTDSRAALDLFHRINESGSGHITPDELASSVDLLPDAAYHRWLLEQSVARI